MCVLETAQYASRTVTSSCQDHKINQNKLQLSQAFKLTQDYLLGIIIGCYIVFCI